MQSTHQLFQLSLQAILIQNRQKTFASSLRKKILGFQRAPNRKNS